MKILESADLNSNSIFIAEIFRKRDIKGEPKVRNNLVYVCPVNMNGFIKPGVFFP
jgi:hypothetical protein